MAYYFALMVSTQDHPILIGPYRDWDDCASVREWVDHRFGNETGQCGMLPYPQAESVLMEVFDIPPEVAHGTLGRLPRDLRDWAG